MIWTAACDNEVFTGAGALLEPAYEDGVDVNLMYDEVRKIVTDGLGPTLVDYNKCEGWEWKPVSRLGVFVSDLELKAVC